MPTFWKSTPFVAALATAIVLLLTWHFVRSKTTEADDHDSLHDVVKVGDSAPGGCKSCSAIDPVLDPAYNMKNIAMQSVLLEEHLCDPKKRCPSCICKHFMHIIGLAQEAVSLAGSKVEDYPFVEDSQAYYQAIFDDWKSDKKGSETIRRACEGLRKRRNAITKEYVLNA